MQNPVIIFGAGPLGRMAKEIFEMNEVVVYGFLDDNKDLHGTDLDEVVVLGETDDEGFLKLIGKKCESFVAIDDNRLKKSIVKMLHEVRHVQPVNAIHPGSQLSRRAQIGHGNFLGQHVTIAAGCEVGSYNIFNTGTNLGVQVIIGDYVQLGAGCNVGHEVVLEDEAFVGAGTTIVSGVKIGKGARVGAGSVVVSSVEAGATVFGNPAQKVKS